MKRAVVEGERRAAVVDAPEPKPVGDWALVRVDVAPLCTEYKAWAGGWKSEYLGHEAAGTVVEVAQPGRVKPGDRVVVMPLYACGQCRLCVSGDYIHCQDSPDYRDRAGTVEGSATLMQYLLKPDWLLPKIPDDLPTEKAALACCALGPSFGAFHRMGVTASDTVLVTGLGPVGLGAIVNAAFRHSRVLAVESVPWRIERALELGAEAVFDPRDDSTLARIQEKTGGRGVDASLDCSGAVAAERLCIDATRRRGQVAYVGECSDSLPIQVSPDMIRKGLTIHGSWHYNLSLFPGIMDVIRRSPVVDRLVSHRFPMSRIQDALETCASHQTAKVLVDPWA